MSHVRYSLRIGGVVLLTTALGLGVFLYVGSRVGVYALVVSLPVVVVGAAIAYARRSRPVASHQTTRFFDEKAKRVGEEMRQLLGQYDRLRDRLSNWDGAGLKDELAYAVEQFADAGVEFDRSTNRFRVTGGGEVRDLERLEARVAELRTELAESTTRHVERERTACIEVRRELREANLVEGRREPTEVSGSEPGDLLTRIEEYDDFLGDLVDEAADSLRDVAEANDHPTDLVERSAADARSAIDRGEYAAVYEVLTSVHEELESGLSTDFEEERDVLESMLDTVPSSVVTEYVDPTLIEDVRAIEREVGDVDTALELATVRRLTDRARDVCIEMIEQMSAELADHMDVLSASAVPEDYYEYQTANDGAYASRLRSPSDLDAFRREWLTAVGELSSAIDAVEEKAAVAEAYDVISAEIDDAIRSSGRVESSDLRVKQPAEFMMLYAAERAEVAYDPSTPALVAEEFGESYDVTVQVGFDEGGPKRTITTALEGPGFADSESLNTHLLDVVSFESVPYGEYALTVSTDESGYSDVERTVAVDGDVELEVTLAEVSLRESVCDGIDEEAREALGDARSLFAKKYAEKEYLSASMEFPITGDYIPCMLTLWAGQENLTVRDIGGDVLVYDDEQFANRLENIVKHNLSSGESIRYSDIRNRYLAVPATDELIIDTLRSSAVGTEIECGTQNVTKR